MLFYHRISFIHGEKFNFIDALQHYKYRRAQIFEYYSQDETARTFSANEKSVAVNNITIYALQTQF